MTKSRLPAKFLLHRMDASYRMHQNLTVGSKSRIISVKQSILHTASLRRPGTVGDMGHPTAIPRKVTK